MSAFTVYSPDGSRFKLESRRIVDDGSIWPAARAEMKHSGLIHERMAEDMLNANPAEPGLHRRLERLGWRADQIAAHSYAATRVARRVHGPAAAKARGFGPDNRGLEAGQ